MTELEIVTEYGAVISGERLARLLGWPNYKSLRAGYDQKRLGGLVLLDLEGRQGLSMTAKAVASYLATLDEMILQVLQNVEREHMRVRPQAIRKGSGRGRRTASGLAIRSLVG